MNFCVLDPGVKEFMNQCNKDLHCKVGMATFEPFLPQDATLGARTIY